LDLKEPRSIMIQAYPAADPSLMNAAAEAEMELMQEVVAAVRNIRAEMGVPPNKKATIVLWGNTLKTDLIFGQLGMLNRLAGIEQLLLSNAHQPHSASAVLGDLEIFIPLEGLIDLDVERARLDKEIFRQQGVLKSIQAKLSNGAFVQNAPAEVVERERQKQADVEAALEKLRRNRRSLD
jgi:valyl-tRNA synthetase